jgi:alkylhydroperoxidase family enzyme
VKSTKKGNGAVATGNDCADTTGTMMKAAEALAVTEEVQACVLAVSHDKELESKEPKILEALQASMDTLRGIVNGCPKAAAMAILAGFSGAIMIGLVRFAS